MENYLQRELIVLRNLKNHSQENIVAYIGACNQVGTTDPHALYIITEYCQGGELLGLLMNKTVELGWKFRVKLALQALSAVHYLHENNIIHRDIKSSVRILMFTA